MGGGSGRTSRAASTAALWMPPAPLLGGTTWSRDVMCSARLLPPQAASKQAASSSAACPVAFASTIKPPSEAGARKSNRRVVGSCWAATVRERLCAASAAARVGGAGVTRAESWAWAASFGRGVARLS